MTTHTPGPWEIYKGHDNEFERRPYIMAKPEKEYKRGYKLTLTEEQRKERARRMSELRRTGRI